MQEWRRWTVWSAQVQESQDAEKKAEYSANTEGTMVSFIL